MNKTVVPFSADIYSARRRKIGGFMNDNTVLVISSGDQALKSFDQLHSFETDRDFLYLTGLEYEHCKLVMIRKGTEIGVKLFIPAVDPQKERWDGAMLTRDKAAAVSGIESVIFDDSFEKFLFRALRYADGLYCTTNSAVTGLPPTGWQEYLHGLSLRFPGTALKKITSELNRARLGKEAGEIERIQQATDIIQEGMLQAMRMIKPGLFEYRIEALILSVYHHHGCSNGFDMIVGSGQNATVLHYNDNNCQMADGDLVLIDTGVSYGSYQSDITRTLPVNGVYTPRQREVYDVNLKIQLACIARFHAGMTSNDLFAAASDIQGRILKEHGFIDDAAKHEHLTVHRIGHPIGLDVHDPVDPFEPLPPGTVITVEPGIYIPEEKIGVRIEDVCVLSENGCEVLSASIPKDPDEIEAYMKTNFS